MDFKGIMLSKSELKKKTEKDKKDKYPMTSLTCGIGYRGVGKCRQELRANACLSTASRLQGRANSEAGNVRTGHWTWVHCAIVLELLKLL